MLMPEKQKWAKTFGYALSGINWTIKNERNFKVHLLAVFLATGLGWLLKITLIEWTIISCAIFFVLTLEMINTALEKVVDLASGEKYHPLAKIAKDVAAGAVLLAAINSVIIGLIIFGKRLVELI